MFKISADVPGYLLSELDGLAKTLRRDRASLVRSALHTYVRLQTRALAAGKVLCQSGHEHDNQEKATVCNAG